MTEHDKIIREFLVESGEGLDRMNDSLLELEQGQAPVTHIANIFRSVHTIKGTCGFLGFSQLEKLAHAAENLLDKMRNGKIPINTDLINTLFVTCDSIRKCLGIIQESGSDKVFDEPELITRINGLSAQASPEQATTKAHTGKQNPIAQQNNPTENTIRLDINLLDKLMNLVGELVLARNKILQISTQFTDVNLTSSSQHLNLITTELQETVMKTRLQPISNVWHLFPRVVRDLALHCHKSIELIMHGEETELDKTIIEAIKDPLTHLVRNAVDHGIESGPERKACGKPEKGTITLKAFHEGGQVNIEISDDGRGINLEKIIQKLKQSHSYTHEMIEKMSERDLIMMIFTPGFSTAKEVTNISGRGVGMDVVKTNIEKIGGSVDAFTKQGKGTTFKIKIPLTLAIIPALIVRCDRQDYAIPQVSLTELVRVDTLQQGPTIEYVHNAPVYRLRGNLLPLVYLRNILDLPQSDRSEKSNIVNIIVLKSLDKTFGLVVDEISDTQEIVVKPLDKQLKNTREFSGATITGDGKVALILDVLGIAQNVQINNEGLDSKMEFKASTESSQTATQADPLLFFQISNHIRMAMSLADVSRLEEFPVTAIQNASDRNVVHYRGHILPLVSLLELYPSQPPAHHTDHLSVIVHETRSQQVGFIVDKILDISESDILSKNDSPIKGVKYSALIGEHITDILDTDKTIERLLPGFFNESLTRETL